MKEKIINNLLLLTGVILIGFIYFFQKDYFYLFLSVSIGLIVFGIILLFKDKKVSLTLSSIGISGILTLFTYYKRILTKYDCITFMACCSLLFIIIITLIFAIVERKLIHKIYNRTIEGEVIDLRKNPNSKKEMYKVICKYTIAKKEYTIETPFYKKRNIPTIGEKIPILISQFDVQEVYFLPEKSDDIFNLLVLLCFAFSCIFIIIFLFI